MLERRALESLDAAVADHFKEVESTAIAKTAEAGEADLRRLKRQFGSLKSSFLHFEVKESFITCRLLGNDVVHNDLCFADGKVCQSLIAAWPCEAIAKTGQR